MRCAGDIMRCAGDIMRRPDRECKDGLDPCGSPIGVVTRAMQEITTMTTKTQRIDAVIDTYLRGTEDTTGPYYVVWSDFHGARLHSVHRKLRCAAQEVVTVRDNTACICGCVKIIGAAECARRTA